jgi:hypothetical protein
MDALTNATIALAAVAGLALIANAYQAWQTRRAVKAELAATEAVVAQTAAVLRQAAASENQAKASQVLAEEAQRNRELDWQPLLRFAFVQGEQVSPSPFVWPQPSLFNDGRGPAYRCVVARKGQDEDGREVVYIGAPVAVGAGQSHAAPNAQKVERTKTPNYVLPIANEWAVYCEDQFGIKYRFLDKGARPDTYREGDDKANSQWVDILWRLAEPFRPYTD